MMLLSWAQTWKRAKTKRRLGGNEGSQADTMIERYNLICKAKMGSKRY